jgi:hypothetical protein
MRVVSILFLLASAVLASTASWATSVSKNIDITITPAGGPSTTYLSASNVDTPSLNSGVNTTIPNGGSAILTWDSTNAGSCSSPNFSTGGSPGIGSATVFPTAGTNTYTVNCGGTAASATVTVSGTRRDAAATYCAANGGGDGSSGNPWHDTCIQAAVNAAAAGDTVFLAAGNWSLPVTGAGVTVAKQLNIVGAGSGNTFDAYGHPNNPTGNPVGTYTRIYTSGTFGGGSGGFLKCTGGGPMNVSHLFVDGSLAAAGSTPQDAATLTFNNCPSPTASVGPYVNDIRSWGGNGHAWGYYETQFMVYQTGALTLKNSMISEAPIIFNTQYPPSQIFQSQEYNKELVSNNIFYQAYPNPFYSDNETYYANQMYQYTDSLGGTAYIPSFGIGGCNTGGCSWNSSVTGSYHLYAFDNYFYGAGQAYETGAGINDPGFEFIVNDLQWAGNWLLADTGAIGSCQAHLFGGTNCASGSMTNTSNGMQVNFIQGTQTQCGGPCNFSITNNSIIATTLAELDATGSGYVSSTAYQDSTINFIAHQNYLSSPSAPQYLNDIHTINASVSNNVGDGAGGKGQMDVAVGSFTQIPTVAFTLGELSNGAVSFAGSSFVGGPTFTAQYGAVKWLASTSSTTPTSGDARWNYLPPMSLAVTHGSTVYMWVMDSVNHISAPASAVVP